MTNVNDYNTRLIDEFRANNGVVDGPFETQPLMLFTHTGAKSGKQRTTPIVYHRDGDRLVIAASKGGAPTNPAWYHNLVAHPDVTVELPGQTFRARATEVKGEERDRLFRAHAELMPAFADYETKTDRKIPIFVLTRVD